MATLDYSSVDNWIKLSAIVIRWFDANKDGLDLDTEQGQYWIMKSIAQTARNMGFNLKQGHRVYGLHSLLAQLDERLVDYWNKHHDTRHPNYHDISWLDVPKTRRPKDKTSD